MTDYSYSQLLSFNSQTGELLFVSTNERFPVPDFDDDDTFDLGDSGVTTTYVGTTVLNGGTHPVFVPFNPDSSAVPRYNIYYDGPFIDPDTANFTFGTLTAEPFSFAPVTPPPDPEVTTTVLDNGNSNINVDGATSEFTDFGGQDTYTVLSSLSADVTIADNNSSTINLPQGLAISSALFLADGVQFTINGNTLTLLGNPGNFDFVFGGTPLDTTAGTSQTFAQTASAFGTSIPSTGAGPNTASVTGTVQADGSIEDASTLTALIGLSSTAVESDYSYF